MAEKNHRPDDNKDPTQETGKRSKERSRRVNAPKAFDIQEVEVLEDDSRSEVDDGGAVDLGNRLDPLERAKKLENIMMRRYITFTILGLSVVWILVGMGYFLWKGSPLLLLTAFPLWVPLLIIMFYFFETRWTQHIVQIMARTS